MAFLVAGALFAFLFVREAESLPNLLIFVFPILLIAGLFYADWKWVKTAASCSFAVATQLSAGRWPEGQSNLQAALTLLRVRTAA